MKIKKNIIQVTIFFGQNKKTNSRTTKIETMNKNFESNTQTYKLKQRRVEFVSFVIKTGGWQN